MTKEDGRFLPWARVVSCLGHHQKEKFGIPGVIVRWALKGVRVHSVLKWPGEVVCFALSSISESSSIANALGPSLSRS